MEQPILITGAARSGTSMVGGIINMCGAFGGNMSGATPYNAKGMYENAHIRNNVVKPYLRALGYDPKGQYPLPQIDRLPIPKHWKDTIEKVMIREGYKDGAWFYKGAKMCLHWPVWHYAFPNAKWIIVRRKTPDIINSCLKTGFMTAFGRDANLKAIKADNEHDGWLWWVHQHEKRFIEMMTEGLNIKVVWPERMVDGDYSQMKEMIEWLGLEWNPEVYNFIEPKLWKARKQKGVK